jgi:hypothetical protein
MSSKFFDDFFEVENDLTDVGPSDSIVLPAVPDESLGS